MVKVESSKSALTSGRLYAEISVRALRASDEAMHLPETFQLLRIGKVTFFKLATVKAEDP